ncbi:peptidylprolyl isomerase [Buchnera aphidicola (Melanaphis sacchari)]|uniref:Periplasmic chaperone PpiD n=1 Tax=Buchnera aphidicola (Melanaphis sacchari) TaxID=2173854 RepID=A0A2U8DF14_9GAMM|nr:peptidylprolyl isomerase [Buchnera aphidicola]AWH90333.1 peptidylprolyl isomerase [Buchnera aphidicola (Melanaphis sacchari)]
MVKNLKFQSNHIVVKFILGIIILSLLFGTINNYLNQNTNEYVAEVNGEKISFETLKNMYSIERMRQKKILGDNFFKISDNNEFKKKTYNYVLSQIIDNVLLEQYIKKINFDLPDDVIKKIILITPEFQENHQFNNKKYLNYLKSINLNNYEYIHLIKKKIKTNKLIHSITETNFILDAEQKNIMQLLSQKRIIKKAILKINPLIEQQKISYPETYNYFNKNKDKFYVPEKFKISYIYFQPDIKKIKCDFKEINEWYKKNINKYLIEEKRKYSIIQTKTKKEATLILSELNNGKSFSKIAKEKSIDPISSKKNGNIGWIEISSMPDEIKNANINKVNQVSGIIKFKNNFLIIKLTEIFPQQPKKINQVAEIIKNEIKYKKSLEIYHKLQKKVFNITNSNVNKFNQVVEQSNIIPIETDWFDKNSIPKKLNNPILKKIIFNSNILDKTKKLKSHSGLITLNNQSFVLSIKDFQEKKAQKFENVKNKITKILKKHKAIKQIKTKLKKIMIHLNNGDESILNQEKIYFKKPEKISRYDTIPIVSTIFSMPYPTKTKNVYTAYQDQDKNFIIIKLLKVYDEKFSPEEKNIIFEYLERNNADMTLHYILEDLREKSIIKYNKTFN